VIERGLHHVSLEVRRPDAEACRDFFVLLGFEKVPQPPALDDIAVWVQHGDLQIHMLYADDPVIPPRGHVAVACPEYEATLEALRAASATEANLMPLLLDAVRAYATLGEICDTLRDAWGEYEETPVI